MARPTREEMLTRERMRLNGMTRLQLFDELYGDSSLELREQLYETYEEEIDEGTIVACAKCGQDCSPEEGAEKDEELTCEDCLEQEEGAD